MIISNKEAKSKGLTRYFTGIPCKKNHICERIVSSRKCVECNRLYLSDRYRKDIEYKNKTIQRLDKLNGGLPRNRWKTITQDKKKQHKRDAYYRNKVHHTMRSLLRRCLKSSSFSLSLIESRLGYSKENLIKRIECQFLRGMSWENHGEWHIDHKKPVSAFGKDQNPILINMLCNLQPLWAVDNLKKGSKWRSNAYKKESE